MFYTLKIMNADFLNRVANKARSRSYAPVQIHKDLHHDMTQSQLIGPFFSSKRGTGQPSGRNASEAHKEHIIKLAQSDEPRHQTAWLNITTISDFKSESSLKSIPVREVYRSLLILAARNVTINVAVGGF